MKREILCFFGAILLTVAFTNASAATLKGHVYDSKSKEALIGCVVYDKDKMSVNATAGLDGSYIIRHLAKGTYTFVAKVFGHTTIENSVTITDTAQVVIHDFLMDAEMMTLGDVKIISNYEKGSDNAARNEEKNADYIMNVVSAKTIELSPDLTIADVLQRVSGVVTDRSVTGAGTFANIRGMDANYNATTIDGVLIPSPDYKNRAIPMNLFPADIVEKVEVYKTLTPDLEGNAIGGLTNLVLKDAPQSFSFSADVATGYNQTFFNRGYQSFDASVINPNAPSEVNGPAYHAKTSDFPTANLVYKDVAAPPNIVSGFTIGDRFLNNKLGVLASVSYQNLESATYGFFNKPQSQDNPGPNPNTPIWDFYSNNYFSQQQTRFAAHTKLDYEFNPRNSIRLYVVYTGMNEQRTRYEEDTLNSLPGSELNPAYESRVTYQHIFNTTLNGRDSLGNHLLLDWTGAYSNSGANRPDWDNYSLLGYVGSSNTIFSSLSRVWMQNTDNAYSAYLNLSCFFKLWGQDFRIKVGGMDRYETRNAFYAEYDWNAAFPQPGYAGIVNTLTDSNLWKFGNTTGSPENNNSYQVQENITAFYGMANFSIGPKIDIVGGLRVEMTNEAYQDGEPDNVVAQSEVKQYTDILPSVEVKFNISKKQAIRANYFASISRPAFFDIVPYTLPGDYFSQYGNYKLDHAQANNYDLRYEFFPNPSEELLAGVFLKQIYNPAELAVVRGIGPSSTIEKPINVGGDSNPVINYGFEFAAIKYFKKFGISANYTYTHSAITVVEDLYYNSVGNSLPLHSYPSETRPLQGQAAHIANLSLIYKEPKIGFQIQVSGVYTGKSIADVSGEYEMDLWQMPMVRLDASFEKKLSKKNKLFLYGKANNLLNTPVVLKMFPPYAYQNTPGNYEWVPNQDVSNGSLSSIIVRKEYFGQTYLIGFRYKF
jgi:hypothetical protein